MKIERNINVSFKFYAYDSDENNLLGISPCSDLQSGRSPQKKI